MAIDARSRGDQINLLTQETTEEREKYAALPFLGKTSTLIFGALSHLGSERRETGRGSGMAQDVQRTSGLRQRQTGALARNQIIVHVKKSGARKIRIRDSVSPCNRRTCGNAVTSY